MEGESLNEKDFADKIAAYFASCFKKTKVKDDEILQQIAPFDVVSLAAFIGIEIKTLKGYLERRDKIGDLTREAFRTIEAYLNKKLITSGRTSGIQFYLKEHFGYDKKVIDINVMHSWSDSELEAQLRMALEVLAAAGEIDDSIIQLVSTGGEEPTYQLPEGTGQARD